MPVTDAITRKFVGAYTEGSVSASARQRRWEMFAATFRNLSDMHVLDVGGVARSWQMSGLRPAHVTLLNVGETPDAPESWMTGVEGDACRDDLDLGTFDVVFSNSVIEHVGGHRPRQQFADLVRSSAPRYWVQTPNKWFPIEPHYLAPGFQFLPPPARARAIAAWPVGNFGAARDVEELFGKVQDIELIGRREMASYFPDAAIISERFGPFAKSLIAVKAA